MKYLFLLTLFLMIFTTSLVNAADYYYCECEAGASDQCIAGMKSNNGTSAAFPKKTFADAAIKFSNFSAGDSILFCRGGSFTANARVRWVNDKCTATNKCNVTSYDLPGQQDPPLSRPIVTQIVNSSLFSLDNANFSDHEEGYTFSNLDLRCTGCAGSGSGFGFFLFNDIDDVSIDNISLDGFRIGIHLAGSNAVSPGSDGVLDNITLNKLTIVNSKSQGILGGANNLLISNSYFENNGSGTNRDHNIYISRGDNIMIRRNELYRSSLNAAGNCAGVPLVVHGNINNLTIQNNIVREDIGKAEAGCWGIAIDTGYDKPEAFTNITIRANKVVNVGNIAIGIASCDNCVIENNLILQQQSFAFTAIKAPDRNRAVDDQTLNEITIRNNSIVTSAPGTAIVLGQEGSGHVVVSNAIHYSGAGRFSCFNFGLAASAYTDIDNNNCFLPNALPASEWEANSGTTPTPLGAWQGQSGFSVNAITTNPGFKNTSLLSLDLSAQSDASAVVNSGHKTLSAAIDYRGKKRDTNPDIGAFEFGNYNPPAKTKLFLIN